MAKTKFEKGVTLIAANSTFEGTVTFQDQLYVNGQVRGNVIAEQESATLVISEEGSVCGEIRVPNVIINGRVEGNVHATARVELAKNAKVKGNVYYKLIEMALGAKVDGQLVDGEANSADASVNSSVKAAASGPGSAVVKPLASLHGGGSKADLKG